MPLFFSIRNAIIIALNFIFQSECVWAALFARSFQSTQPDGVPSVTTANLDKPRIHVDADATDANNGSSWADAYTNIPSALDAAITGDINVGPLFANPSEKRLLINDSFFCKK